jgi:hypothetical protein
MIDAIRGAKLALDRAFLVFLRRFLHIALSILLLYRCHFQATAFS